MIRATMNCDKRFRNHPKAAEMYRAGMSLSEIASFYGRTRQAMWEWLKNRGVKMRSQKRAGKRNHFYRGGRTASDKAQNILEKAIKKGVVKRLQFCEQCGSRGQFKDGRTSIQAHHPDYNDPLRVLWLCQKCHHNWHKHFKAIERR